MTTIGEQGPRGQAGQQGATGARGRRGADGLEGPPVSKRTIYLLVALFTSQLALVAGDVQYGTWRAARADQRWCAVIISVDNTLTETPPTTESGRAYAANMHKLRIDLGCK
jgi:hypothetical protein